MEGPAIKAEDVINKDGFYIFVDDTASFIKTVFFTARFPCELLWISECHTTAGTGAGSVTLQLEKLTGTQAPGAGANMLNTAFDLKGTANTVVLKGTTDLTVDTTLAEGDRIALKYSGTLTSLVGVQVTLYCKPLGRGLYRV